MLLNLFFFLLNIIYLFSQRDSNDKGKVSLRASKRSVSMFASFNLFLLMPLALALGHSHRIYISHSLIG